MAMAAPVQDKLGALATEARNPATERLDELSTLDMLKVMNDEDAKVASAVRAELPTIAAAVNAISERFRHGGRLFYTGAGTSGRLGVLDASECPPTFSVAPEMFQGIIAGGERSLRLPSEHSEDSREEGVRDLQNAGFLDEGRPDTLIGIAASGRTPYVLAGIDYARMAGALTIGISSVEGSALAEAAQISICPLTGPEILTGSTRLKAGTATKMVLNMISTGVMVRTGATYGNLMVNVRASNEKLVARAQRIIAQAAGCDFTTAGKLLDKAENDVKVAIVMHRLSVPRKKAMEKLVKANGVLRDVLRG